MSGVANRQVASLSRELWRMERRNDLLKRRLEWLEGKAGPRNRPHMCCHAGHGRMRGPGARENSRGMCTKATQGWDGKS